MNNLINFLKYKNRLRDFTLSNNRSLPLKKLSIGLKKNGGRNMFGRTTIFTKFSNHRTLYRLINFRNTIFDEYGKVLKIEYDPIRTANIGLVYYKSGLLSYQLAAAGLKVDDIIFNTKKYYLTMYKGCNIPLYLCPKNMRVFNLNLNDIKSKISGISRSAGTFILLLKRFKKLSFIKYPSGFINITSSDNLVTVGQASFPESRLKTSIKAGNSFHKGIRPTVRGVAMNPIDHPHGGGEGKKSPCNPPKTPWSKITKGQPTVKSKKNMVKKLMKLFTR